MKLNYVKLISFLIPIIFMSLMLQYLAELEKKECECAITEDRVLLSDLIKYYLLAILISTVLSMGTNVIVIFLKNILGLVIVFLFLYLSVVFFRYNKDLKEVACECSQNDAKTAFKYYLYFYYFSLILFTLSYMYVSAVLEVQQGNPGVSKKKL